MTRGNGVGADHRPRQTELALQHRDVSTAMRRRNLVLDLPKHLGEHPLRGDGLECRAQPTAPGLDPNQGLVEPSPLGSTGQAEQGLELTAKALHFSLLGHSLIQTPPPAPSCLSLGGLNSLCHFL